ncbi:MAG: acyltransferase [Treponema sp.]|nr:acyltransferase [Treponema sp.]
MKCFAIFCVLWFHAIEVLNDANTVPTSLHFFPRDPVHIFIVTFNMPLFFMISGFFFSSSLKLSFKEVLWKRFLVLIIPHIAWIIILALADWAMPIVGWGRATGRPFSILGQLEAFFKPDPRTDLWFFKDLFITDLIIFASCKIFKKLPVAFIASMLFVLLFDCFGVVGKVQRFMLPIFWTGILLKTHYHVFTKHLNKLLIGFGILFAVSVYLYDFTYMIYRSDFPPIINFQQSFAEGKVIFNFTDIDKSGFRLLAGVAGSLFFFALFQRIWKKNVVTTFLSRCGQLTVAIYGLQAILLQRVMVNILDFSGINMWLYWVIITPIAAAFTFFACVLLTRLIQKNKPLSFMLFGSSLVANRPAVRNKKFSSN